MTQKVPAAMVAADVATQAELDSEAALRAAGDAAAVVFSRLPDGTVLQVARSFGALNTGSTLIPADNTIPQNTEGTQFYSVSITPKLTTSRLLIEVRFFGANTVTNNPVTVAVFRDSAANAVAAGMQVSPGTANLVFCVALDGEVVSGSLTPTTFSVRVGAANASTTTMNGASGAQLLGGAMASSITVTEVKA